MLYNKADKFQFFSTSTEAAQQLLFINTTMAFVNVAQLHCFPPGWISKSHSLQKNIMICHQLRALNVRLHKIVFHKLFNLLSPKDWKTPLKALKTQQTLKKKKALIVGSH